MNKKIIEKGIKKWEGEQLVGKAEEVDDLRRRVKALEDKVSDTREEALVSNLKYYKMITQAVTDGIKPIVEKIEEQEKRIVALENADAKKALEEKKDRRKFIRDVVIAGIVTVTIGWIVLGFLNNFASITTQAIAENKGDDSNEIIQSNK